MGTATHLFVRGSHTVLHLPAWHRSDSFGLLCALLVVPLLVAGPFTRVGERDSSGNQRYRAYFTADFLWHVALTAELVKAEAPIRNPYLARRALNYYWAYFVPPAMIARAVGAEHSLEACLLLNALCAGLLFVASIYLCAGAWFSGRTGGALSHHHHRCGQRGRHLRLIRLARDNSSPPFATSTSTR
jgi:hypothetical protein